MDTPDARLHLTLTPAQGEALNAALDLYCRVGLGQLESLGELVRHGVIPVRGESGQPRGIASPAVCDQVDLLLDQIKALLGYAPNASLGIGHRHVALDATRSYEILKAAQRALAEYRDPTPRFRGVNYDGLVVRYTQDPAPLAEVQLQPET